MSRKLIRQLEHCNIERAACKLIRGFQGKIVKNEIADSLNLFTNIPCPETATNFSYEFPEALVIMFGANDALSNMIPKESYGQRLREEEEWISVFNNNLKRVSLIHDYLLNEAIQGKATIGFHRMRDQQILFERLKRIGIKKFPFINKRQFLRRVVTKKLSAFRGVNDLVCIHGVHNGCEIFWNGLGAEEHPQWHLKSEIQYDLGENTSEFIKFLKNLDNL
jgi:hypothetical protein